jgi:biotin transporter BioY
VTENSAEEKPLRTASFVVHATRGVIRDQNTRRKCMLVLLVTALVLLVCGSTFLHPILNPREHLAWSLLFWFACLWLTLTALLLAIFDLLIVRSQARKVRRALREKYAQTETPRSPSAPERE